MGLTKQEEVLDRTHRKHRRIIWNNPYLTNKQVYEKSVENKLSDDMRMARWKALGHMLRRKKDTPCQQAMEYFFDIPEKAKKFKGKRRCTLPMKLNEDVKKVTIDFPISQFERKYDLKALKTIAIDRRRWYNICKVICSSAEGNTR